MAVDPDFIFSANSLQDYLDCPRRFELKYMLKQSWPAASSEPVLEFERHMQLGSRFHQLVYQFLNGVPRETLLKTIEDNDLEEWFHNFLAYYTQLDLGEFHAELPVKIMIHDFPVIAVFDLFALARNGDLYILDWKTAKRIPQKTRLADRIQTLLYPLAATEAAPALLSNTQIRADKVHMNYLYVRHKKENTIIFDHSKEQNNQNKMRLEKWIAEINAKESGAFEFTTETKRCKYCVYRSLCERGVQAGDFQKQEEELDLDQLIETMDFDAQDEIAF